jgi:hypothetical protein
MQSRCPRAGTHQRQTKVSALRRPGYEIVSVSGHADVDELTRTPFDIAIVCQSVDPDRAICMLAALRQSNPKLRILRINRYRDPPAYSFDVEYELPARPSALLRAAAALRGEVRRSA